MSHSHPLVSIGLPVYNGERYLATAIDVLLAQSFTDFELILTDNASTDSTPEICARYVAQDRRVSYFRNASNVGAAENHNIVFRKAQGTYFKWAGNDDGYAPTYLEECVATLEREPTFVVAYPKTSVIDAAGNFVQNYEDNFHLDAAQPHLRFRYVLRHPKEEMLNPALGLTRTGVLRKTQLIGNYFASDRVLLAELALYGKFYEVPNRLFFRRLHEESSSHNYLQDAKKSGWFNPANRGQISAPRWKRFVGYLQALKTAPLSGQERLLCSKEFAEFYLHPNRWRGAALDLAQIRRALGVG